MIVWFIVVVTLVFFWIWDFYRNMFNFNILTEGERDD